MGKVIAIGALVFFLFIGGLTSCSHVQPGHVGIKVSNIGSSAGVSNVPLNVGYYFAPPGTSIYEYPVYTSTYTWTSSKDEGKDTNEQITFQDRNGLGLSADVAVAYHVDASKAPILFQKYRTDMDGIVAGPLRNAVRNAIVDEASQMGVEDIYGPKKAQLSESALRDVQNYFKPYGLVVDQLYWASNIRVPDQVMQQINQKISNEQAALAAQANVATVTANANSKVAQAEGDAKAMQVKGDAIRANPEILEQTKLEKWDGKLPEIVLGGNATPMISISK
jgi:regulator of protease activity HflC (stomatin/prohibitin superfamily)